ncbi:MAG: hypothetical protein ABIH36_02605 [bacterium]
MNRSSLVLTVLFVLLAVANAAYLHRVPGLFGDEAGEGENVYELRMAKRFVVMGERSYIGPLVDYARLPFVLVFGYSALALRVLMWLVSAATFVLAAVVFRRLFGESAYLWALAAMFFSPAYLLYQRLGWAITLFPFFALLLLFFLTDKRVCVPYRSALVGLAAGLGLHNYIVFLPAIAGIIGPWLITFWRRPKELLKHWLVLLGFWAGFGTQFAVLQLISEDQGVPREVIGGFWGRVADLPGLLPLVLSGSSYVARYTGNEFSGLTARFITLGLAVLVAVALGSKRYRRISFLWLLGLIIQLLALTFIIDRFTLRYFVLFVLGVWTLAGVGLGVVAQSLLTRRAKWLNVGLPIVLTVLLMAWTVQTTLVPYLKTDGSTGRFSLGNRTDTSAHFAATVQLYECLDGVGPVYSDDPHILNALIYTSHGRELLSVPVSKYEAHWLVDYVLPGEEKKVTKDQICLELEHFRVIKRK